MDWKEELLEAFKLGKTIQCNHNNLEEWHDYVPHNQIDRPNLGYGTKENWRIKPTADEERKEILEKSGSYKINPMMQEHIERTGIPFPSQQKAKENKEKLYTRDQLFLFAGFCMARKRMDPGKDVGEILNEFNATFGHG